MPMGPAPSFYFHQTTEVTLRLNAKQGGGIDGHASWVFVENRRIAKELPAGVFIDILTLYIVMVVSS